MAENNQILHVGGKKYWMRLFPDGRVEVVDVSVEPSPKPSG